MSIRIKEEEALDFLNVEVGEDLIAACNVSGGKDSTVIEHLCRRAGIKYQIYHGLTTIDPPELYKYVKTYYPKAIIARPKYSFWECLHTKKGIVPSRKARWCCAMIKHGPLDAISKEPVKIIGTRAEESSSRKKLPRTNFYKDQNQLHIYPILNWNEADVWEYIEKYNLPYCSLYDEEFDRTGCIVCPQRGKKQHEMYRDKYPGMFKVFEHGVKRLWLKRVKQGHEMFYTTPEEFLTAWYKDSNARWYAK